MIRLKPILRVFLLTGAVVLAIDCRAESVQADVEPSIDSPYCLRHSAERHAQTSGSERLAAQHQEVLAYQSLAEEVLSTRAQAIELYEELRAKARRGEPLSGNDLLRLNQGAKAMLARRKALFEIAEAHECWLDLGVSNDPEMVRAQAAGMVMSLSAALLLYDNYALAISLYRSNLALRRHLNQTDSGFEIKSRELDRITLSYASPANRYRVRRALHWFERGGREAFAPEDNDFRYLVDMIDQSPSRNIVRRFDPVGFVGRMFGLLATAGFDTLFELKDQSTFMPSMLFGNAVGLVESRRGKLDDRQDVHDRVVGALRAGDILLEKTPFRLTDSFIPGHWGHVAIWVGTPDELKALGLWDRPEVRPFQAAIRNGHGVVEALRSGVKMNPIQHFLNIDDLAVLRETGLSEAQRAQVILHTLRQVGKAYDFNFDVESTDRIVCSELVYHAYSHHQWPTAKYLGRSTISPDNVARNALPAGYLNTVVLYHDGEEVATDQGAFMARLLKQAPAAPPSVMAELATAKGAGDAPVSSSTLLVSQPKAGPSGQAPEIAPLD